MANTARRRTTGQALDQAQSGGQHEVTMVPTETSPLRKDVEAWYRRQDILVWISGMVFIAALVGAMFGLGGARGWDALSGFTHNASATSKERFLPEPFEPEEGVRGRYGVEAAARWYYWKLKPDDITTGSRVFVWMCYSLHQTLVWLAIYRAQVLKAQDESGKARHTTQMDWYGWVSFALTIVFHLLHLLNTHTTYDATAQDVSISTSQGSVIMLLILVMLMDYRERGVVFGWPSKHDRGSFSEKATLNLGPTKILKKYHGYAVAWGCIYTFWYHPMENTWGHALGFMHTFMIMLQGSLMYTKLHQNRYWRVFIEMWVILHGGIVASQTGGPEMDGTLLWPMFGFGFAFVFVVTQIFTFQFWRRIPFWTRILPFLVYMGVVIWAYSWIKDREGRTWVRMNEIIRIPGTYYLFFLVIWLLLYSWIKLDEKLRGPNPKEDSPNAQVAWFAAAMLIYAIFIGYSIILEYGDIQFGLIGLMLISVFVFMFGVSISTMFLSRAVPSRKSKVKGDKRKIGDIDGEPIVHESETVQSVSYKRGVDNAGVTVTSNG